MKVRCIKEYECGKVSSDDYVSRPYYISKGECFKTINNGLTENIITSNGTWVTSLDDKDFFEYFEIIDEDEKVNHPEHYNQGEMETIDVIEYVLSDINGKYAFALGNIIKYVVRANMKGGKEDLDKAKWYIEHLIGGLNE